jgi:hypothetical protein
MSDPRPSEFSTLRQRFLGGDVDKIIEIAPRVSPLKYLVDALEYRPCVGTQSSVTHGIRRFHYGGPALDLTFAARSAKNIALNPQSSDKFS